MRKARVLMLIGLVLLGAGCHRKPEVLPLSDEEKDLAKQAADAFLAVVLQKDFKLEEAEKHVFSRMQPLWRPRLALSIRQARTSSKCEWLETYPLMSDMVNVRYVILVDRQDMVLVLSLAKEEDGQYKVTAANIVERTEK